MSYKLQNYGITIDPRDEQYILKTPEPGFSPEHNKRVIANSIKKAEALRLKKWANYRTQLSYRSNALVSYFRYLDTGKGGQNPFNKYFSRKMRAYLRGEALVETLQGAYRTVNNSGQIITYHT